MKQSSGGLSREWSLPHEVWHRLTAAADDPAHPMRLMVLASVDGQGRPAARSLVIRGTDAERGILWFHTDMRSRKVGELRARPGVCIVCYDPRDGVQLRVDGVARVRSDDALADRRWSQLDHAAQYAYMFDDTPGAPIARNQSRPAALSRVRLREGAIEDGRRHFAVLEIEVAEIEWFQTNELGQSRARLKRCEGWRAEPLCP